ncbi:hypothetical protein MUB24_14100 [Lederbergia sp. NSJ-179]|uniref:hypothetical protein n=1 Tax=Lederbergia sp. NSJ-179 TaxID=2931402 RepID=UPI001FD4F5FC|nr:hypothetical protein [Lederbergia sp. NSJ-179]MCJ7842013.1 hypothetical protein [Lederbergia sp. NSJ-179]
MSLLLFELKKVWRQKKLWWIFAIILLCTFGLFQRNLVEQKGMVERAYEKVEPLSNGVTTITEDLRAKVNQTGRTPIEGLKLEKENGEVEPQWEEQLSIIYQIRNTLFQWRLAIENKQWAEIPKREGEFWAKIAQYEQAGGFFGAVQGVEREKAKAKNQWMMDQKIAYVDERYPVVPALFLLQSAQFQLGIWGLIIFVLFFGGTISDEREQQTWLTLKTQPIPGWKRIITKYISLLIFLLFSVFIVASISFLLPIVFGYQQPFFHYPIMIDGGEHFFIRPAWQNLLYKMSLFFGAASFACSLICLYSLWIKKTFTHLLLLGMSIFIGVMATVLWEGLQITWNPFFSFYELWQAAIPRFSPWLFLLSISVWNIVLLCIAARLPEQELDRQTNPVQKPFARGKTSYGKRKGMRPIVFEYRKTIRQGLLKQTLLLLCFLLCLGYIYVFQEAKNREATYLEELENPPAALWVLSDYEQELEEIEALDLDESKKEELGVDRIEEQIASYKEFIEKGRKAVEAYRQGDWKTFYNYQKFTMQQENGEVHYDSTLIKLIGKMAIDISYAEKDWMIAHQVQPVFPGKYALTIFQDLGDWETGKDIYIKGNQRLDSSGLFLLGLYFDKHVYLMGMILIFFLVGGFLADEKGKQATLRLLQTQPLSLRSLFFGKLLHSYTIALLISIIVIGFILFLGVLFDRFGDWQYPVFIYDSAKVAESANYTGHYSQGMGFHFLPLGEYMIQNFVLALLALYFVLTLSNVCSLILPHKLSVLACTLLIIGICYVSSVQFFPNTAHFLPFIYMNVVKITKGEQSVLFNNPSLTFETGVIVLLISIIVLIVVASLLCRQKKKSRRLIID